MFTGSDFERDRNRMNALENDSLDEFSIGDISYMIKCKLYCVILKF